MTCNQTIQSGSNIPVLNTVQALRTFNNYQDEMTIIVLGNLSYSDGNGGIYTFDSTSTLADDGINTIQPTSIASGTPGRYILTNLNSSADGLVTALKAQYASSSGASLIGYQYDNNTSIRTVQNRLTDSVSVKDFGAVGDGTTDDTASFKNAINSGIVKIIVPVGNYLITDSSIIMENTCSFDGPGNFLFQSYTIPCGEILIGHVILPVPQVFPQPNNALGFLNGKTIKDGSLVTIQVADGTYTGWGTISPSHPDGDKIQILGNTTSRDNVKVMVDLTNSNKFLYISGSRLGLIDGFSIIGSKGWVSTGVWDESITPYGAAIYADADAFITVGSEVFTQKMYYGFRADHNATILIRENVLVNEYGDVGYHAYGGGCIYANNCYADTGGHTSVGLGCGFMAEFGGVMQCEMSNSHAGGQYGYAAFSNGVLWGLGLNASYNGTFGIVAANGGHLIALAYNNTVSDIGYNKYGASAHMNGSLELSGAKVHNNTLDGVNCNMGSIDASNTISNNNGGCGYIVRANGVIFAAPGTTNISTDNVTPDTANTGGILGANSSL